MEINPEQRKIWYLNRPRNPAIPSAEIALTTPFHDYTKGLLQFYGEPKNTISEYDVLPEPIGVSRENLFSHLTAKLNEQGYTSDQLNKLQEVYLYAHLKFATTDRMEFRSSGDETITHSLWMAIILAENGITDIDVQMATLCHDILEDTGADIEELKLKTSEKAARLVDLVSKVKTKKIFGPSDMVTSEDITERENLDQKNTELKLLDAIQSDDEIYAFIIKAADVIHNQITSEAITKKIRERKGGIALDYYEKWVRRLGFTYFADLIGNYALKSVQIDRYENIKAEKDKTDNIFMPYIQKIMNDWVDYETYEGNELNTELITIESSSIYQIHKDLKNQPIDSESHKYFIPHLNIVCTDETELFKWHRFFSKALDARSTEIDERLNLKEAVEETIILVNGKQPIKLKVFLKTKDMLIEPAHLFINTISLTEDEEQIARSKLESLRIAYKQALSSDTLEEVTETMERGSVNVLDKEGNPRSVPSHATALDLAYIIGKNLGNDTVGVNIYKLVNGEWTVSENSELDTPLTEGVKAEFLTENDQTIEPNRYELVTTGKATTNIEEKMTQQLVETAIKSTGLSEDSEVIKTFKGQLQSGQIIRNIRSILGVEFDENTPYPEFIQKIRDRGVRTIEHLYSKVRGKKLDTNISDVFPKIFEEQFGSKDDFLINVGLIVMPFNKEGSLEKWMYYEDTSSSETILPTRKIIERLIAFRESRWIMEFNANDKSGVLFLIAKHLYESEANVHIRSYPDNYARGRKTRVEIRFTRGSRTAVSQIKKDLMRELGGEVTFIEVSREKDRRADTQS
ncbi:MAG: (P)ppGpp synthetase, RelA/SpoT family [Candidatus Woesebacteria bacterium GW2011_GWB1_38_8]|uniref:(P)ppGpp synthetase, RelA/SpoT family n=1 Tax=Candidatus Woesebacteria bacterium GW2011_GWB1_38_8 TaxID=1618570 RepID=A0A0G0NHG6_9BACT|nr:MAG: (P)ppGpp synthetase, RelA/SpoT family [Candidatus Woesebacteria bacterium GW2011_GWB1_38_8]